tara:strand:- start:122 stop:289 length:168 start_codon:yes stop_codon:yes gene_type:complete
VLWEYGVVCGFFKGVFFNFTFVEIKGDGTLVKQLSKNKREQLVILSPALCNLFVN